MPGFKTSPVARARIETPSSSSKFRRTGVARRAVARIETRMTWTAATPSSVACGWQKLDRVG